MKSKTFKKCISAIMVLVCVISFASCGRKVYSRQSDNDAVNAAKEIKAEILESECLAEKYTMDLKLDTEKNTVSGKVVAVVLNKSANTLSEVCFRFFSPAIEEGSKISSAKNPQTNKKYDVSSGEDNTIVMVNLNGDSIETGKSKEIELNFTSVIPENDERYGYSSHSKGKLYNLTFCFPQVAILDGGEWFDAPYFDAGETTYNEMSDYYVTLTAPEDYVVLGSGNQETEKGKTTIKAEKAREMAIVACNFAEVESKEVDGVTFNLLKPEYEYNNKKLLNDIYDLIITVAVEAVELFSEKVGDYIYDELDIIPLALTDFGGMEMPGFVQIALPSDDSAIVDDIDDFRWSVMNTTNITCHEVGHQWFYCAVGNDQYNEPWLDESFTSYLEGYYARNAEDYIPVASKICKTYFEYTVNYQMDNTYEQDEGVEYYINLPAIDYEEDYGYVYSLGENFFRALENAMGEEKFFEMLSEWYEENTYGIVDGYQFVQHLLEYDSSEEVVGIVNSFLSAEYLK